MITKTKNFYGQMVERNIGVITAEEQERLRNTCVAVAGCGGMGGLSAEQLVRLGVGHVKIADFDTFAIHNLSRQCGSTTSNIGHNKAGVLGRHFKSINPGMNLEVYEDGVTPENVEKFVSSAEIIIDGTDFSTFSSTILMYQAARKNNICVINPNAIGFGVNVFVFGPKTISIEEHLGLASGTEGKEALLKLVPYLPSYIDPKVVQKVMSGEMNIPNLAMPQYLGTSIAVSEATMIILGRVKPPAGPSPRIFILDLQDRKFSITG